MPYRAQTVRVDPPKPKQWHVDGWTGMYDSRSHAGEQPGKAPILINFIPTDPERGGSVVLRSGRRQWGASSAPDLGTTPQYTGFHQVTTNAALCVAVVDGEIYTLDYNAKTTTKVVTTANFATAVITRSTSSKWQACDYNGTIVFTDGTNRPFTWDGTAGAGGLVSLSNGPSVVVGAPTVYYAKLFFIKSDKKTIVWSEENQANTGYEAGGYNNAWALTQTSRQELTALVGTNDGLYYWRTNSVGVIRGAVSSTFSTDGVHDSIAIGVGAADSFGVCLLSNAVFWCDVRQAQWAYRPDVGLVDLAAQVPRIYGGITTGAHPDVNSPYGGMGEEFDNFSCDNVSADAIRQRVHFGGLSSGDYGRVSMVYDAQSLNLLCVFGYPTTNTPASGANRLNCFARDATSNDGFEVYLDSGAKLFYEVTSSSATVTQHQDYTDATSGTAVVGKLIGPMHGWSPTTEWKFTQLDVLADALTANSVTVGYITSRAHKVSLTPADQTYSDSGQTTTPYERRTAFGLNADGRWIRPLITLTGGTTVTVDGLSAAGSRAQLFGYTLTAYPVSTSVSVT